jgi:DNA-binding NarL/FixJ family response regulator
MDNPSSERPWFIESIRQEARQYSDRARKAGKFGHVPEKDPAKSMFRIHTANHWMDIEKDTPVPKMLFGEFWYEGELCILFADTNAGKSVLAVQIGDALARRHKIANFEIETEQANVVYLDFELSGKQFQSRYINEAGVSYRFGKGFYRAGFDPAADMPFDFKTYDEYMNSAVEYAVKSTGADVLIIDNITSLRSGTERAADALPLMKHLKALKTKLQISILVLAHTPKRNPAVPITRNDLQGSKMLINFADSAFAIGESHREKGLRYLKQVKQRSTTEIYGETNVCLCRITRPLNFLQFDFVGHAAERVHLYRPTQRERELMEAQVLELAKQGLSNRQVAAKLNMGATTVNRIIRANEEGVPGQ